MYGLTTNQRAFADEYISNKGNGTQAYLAAYPNVKKTETAATNSWKLLRNAKVQAYIKERTENAMEKAKLSGDDIVAQLLMIATRQAQESYSRMYDHLEDEVKKETTLTHQPSFEDTIDAIELLGKWLGYDRQNSELERKRLELANEKTKVEIEKLKSQIGGDEGQDEKIAGFISQLKDVITDE